MDLQTIAQNIVTNLVISGFLVGILGVFQTIFLTLLTFLLKYTVENQQNRELEQLKSQLARVEYEHQTQFSELHERRAEVIAELYGKLAVAEHSLVNLLATIGENTDREVEMQLAQERITALYDYSIKHAIYFDETLAQKLLSWVANPELVRRRQKEIEQEAESLQKLTDKTRHSIAKIPSLKREIEKEFRQLLGISGEQ